MKGSKLRPSPELLQMVMTIADAKARLPLQSRGHLNDWGVYCRVNSLPNRERFYQAGGKFLAKIRFTLENDGSVVVHKYKPGEWELTLESVYEHAKFWSVFSSELAELEKVLESTDNAEAMISLLEERVRQGRDDAGVHLGNAYAMGGRFKDAEREYVRGVETWPNVFSAHFYIGRFYLHAVAKAAVTLPPNLSSSIWVDVTAAALGYTLEQVVDLVERHFEEALRLTPPQAKTERTIMEGTLVGVRDFRSRLGSKDMELMQAGEVLEDNPEKAVGMLEQIVAQYPSFADGWGVLGTGYLQTGRPKEAEEALMKATGIDPKNAVHNLQLGFLYQVAAANSRGALERGATELLRQMADDGLRVPKESLDAPELPEFVDGITLEALSCTYEHARQMAEVHLKKVLDLTGDNELRRAAKSRLAELKMLDEM